LGEAANATPAKQRSDTRKTFRERTFLIKLGGNAGIFSRVETHTGRSAKGWCRVVSWLVTNHPGRETGKEIQSVKLVEYEWCSSRRTGAETELEVTVRQPGRPGEDEWMTITVKLLVAVNCG